MSYEFPSSSEPSVFDALSGATANGSNAIAYPSPLPGGIAGLVFDWTGDERLELRSEITDSWVEDNEPIHDQIALYPERFTLDASTAEIVFLPSSAGNTPPQPANPLPILANMAPTLTPGASLSLSARGINASISVSLPPNTILPPDVQSALGQTAYMAQLAAKTIGQVAQAARNLAALPATLGPILSDPLGSVAPIAGSSLGSSPNSPPGSAAAAGTNSLWQYYLSLQPTAKNNQAMVMGFIYQLWKGRQRFTIETPWGIFASMVIETADGTQPGDTPGRTDHRITFKRFNVAKEILINSQAVGRNKNQATESNPQVNGTVGKVPAAVSTPAPTPAETASTANTSSNSPQATVTPNGVGVASTPSNNDIQFEPGHFQKMAQKSAAECNSWGNGQFSTEYGHK